MVERTSLQMVRGSLSTSFLSFTYILMSALWAKFLLG